MAALVPLNNADALPRLHEAGVEEIYVGFHDDEWESYFGNAELNRMSGFGREANPFSFERMCELIMIASDLGIRSYVCFNATSYSADQIDYIRNAYLPRLAQVKAQGIILSSQALVSAGLEAGLQIVMSTIAGVLSAALACYYRDLGVGRLILPRELSVAEIEGIVQAVPELEYEVFLMRNGCMFSDSHCVGCHRKGNPSLCMSLRTGEWSITASASAQESEEPEELEEFLERARYNEWLLNTHYHKRTCGLCALWRFEQLGIAAYKVVGRGDDADDLIADAALVVRNSALARACATEEDYLKRMEPPRVPETLCGMNGLSCYYPEVSRL